MSTDSHRAQLPVLPTYDAEHFGLKMSKEISMTTVEDACTSPIWYTPGN